MEGAVKEHGQPVNSWREQLLTKVNTFNRSLNLGLNEWAPQSRPSQNKFRTDKVTLRNL